MILHETDLFKEFKEDNIKRIKELRENYPIEELYKKASTKKIYQGLRFYNNERIFYEACSTLIKNTEKRKTLDKRCEDAVDTFKKLSSEDKDNLFVDSIIKAGIIDWRYKFELPNF